MDDDTARAQVTAAARWRAGLEQRGERKLSEVTALAGACQGVSAPGDDLPDDGATLPSCWLYCRAAAAYEDLGMIADAIARVHKGTFGQCDRCKQPMTDDWLSRDPLRLYCPSCSLPRNTPASRARTTRR
jgi:RNA polymerase-binding transcription factor DksA